ncbi:hypothetical protein AVEN_273546-1 [Araneus ventricosus]|uniref:Integrase catalytic domain-containing protein n=1 Tax=Araneus ventricosus TaxID=182803 RepID=A0A4Y2L6B4_ARAVE|nr:hypothetical protein AVEN_273546-1 [Araneus ventricosus]
MVVIAIASQLYERGFDPRLEGIWSFVPIYDEIAQKNSDPSGKKWLQITPRNLRLEILQNFHDALTDGHLGFSRTYDGIRKRFFRPGLYKSVRRYVVHYQECQRRKSVPQKPPGLLVPIPPATVPFRRVGINLLGRFPKSTRGNKWIIVCTDYLSRSAATEALPTAEAQEVTKFMIEEIVLKHGAPRVITTGRVKVFLPKLATEINQLCNSRHRISPPNERINRVILQKASRYDFNVRRSGTKELGFSLL